MTARSRSPWLAGLALLIVAVAFAGMATKLRVTHIPGAPVYKTPVLGQPIATLPLNTVLEAEVKQGEFWKVSVELNGVKTTGYVHEFLVEVVAEGDVQGGGQCRGQHQLAARQRHRVRLADTAMPATINAKASAW